MLQNFASDIDIEDLAVEVGRHGAGGARHLSIAVNSIAEFAGTFEGDNFTLSKDQVRSGRGVTATALVFAFYAKLAESRDENVIALFEGRLHDFQKRLDNIN